MRAAGEKNYVFSLDWTIIIRWLYCGEKVWGFLTRKLPFSFKYSENSPETQKFLKADKSAPQGEKKNTEHFVTFSWCQVEFS